MLWHLEFTNVMKQLLLGPTTCDAKCITANYIRCISLKIQMYLFKKLHTLIIFIWTARQAEVFPLLP